jgi:hypothetical protein
MLFWHGRMTALEMTGVEMEKTAHAQANSLAALQPHLLTKYVNQAMDANRENKKGQNM